MQRIFAARTADTLRRSLAIMAFMPLATTLLAFLIGYVGLSRFPGLDRLESDKITVYVLGDLVDTSAFAYWLVVFVFAAVVAAIMSTADSALLSLGSMLTKDIYRPYFKPEASPRELLIVGKTVSWVLMAVLITMAWVSLETESSLWLLIRLKLEFMVQLAPALVLGVYSRRLTSSGVFWGMLLGTGITLVIWVGVALGVVADRSPMGINAGVWGLVANVAVSWLGRSPKGAA